jgi:hypothetical protein
MDDPTIPHAHPDGEVHAHEEGANGQYSIPPPQGPVEVACAFLVYVMPDGKALANSNMDVPLQVTKPANLDDMYGACAQVMRDIQNLMAAPMVAQAVLNGQMQMAAQAQQAMADQQIAQKLMMPNRQMRRQ